MADIVQTPNPNQTEQDPRVRDLLQVSRARFQEAVERDGENRKKALDDLKFRGGEQWPADIKAQRLLEKRPCLTINKLPQFIRQVTNEQRQNRPGIKISPVDDKSDVKTARVIQGLIRHIWEDSNGDVAVDTGFEAAATHGRGFWRILTEYEDDMSFDQCIKLKRVRNPFTVYCDPAAQEADYSDMQWAFVVQEVNKDLFKAMYPHVDGNQMEMWTATGDMWIQTDRVRVAEYFYLKHERKTLIEYAIPAEVDGNMAVGIGRGYEDEIEKQIPSGRFEVLRSRKVLVPTVKWCKHNGYQLIEEEDWPGRYIPIVPVLGDEIDIEGKVTLSGIVRDAKDPQRMVNFWATSEAETIALAPRAPYVAAQGQIEGFERIWGTANSRNHSYLPYNPMDVSGHLVPPPQRNNFEPAVQAVTNARLLANDDMKGTIGIYDAGLGNRSNETSGKGIIARREQSDRANLHYADNLVRSIRHTGKILVDLIPRIYDAARVVRILGEDGSEETVMLNQEFTDPKTKKPVLYDLTTGKYDVTVDAGPSYQTKREEAVEAMTAITSAVPDLINVIGDLLVKNMDWPGAQEMSERLKRLVPPNVLAGSEGDDEDREAQLEAMIPELQKQLEALNEYAKEIEAKMQECQAENESLKKGFQIKQEELVLKARELDLKKQEFDLKEYVERRKLQIEEERLELEAVDRQEAQEGQEEAA